MIRFKVGKRKEEEDTKKRWFDILYHKENLGFDGVDWQRELAATEDGVKE